MADAQKHTITDPNGLLPDYYTTLGVPYSSSQEAIGAAFISLTDDGHTFHEHKQKVNLLCCHATLIFLLLTRLQICDAFMCLASSGDRAAYDAFYFHTPCWYSKALWLSYRDEHRRLTWDSTAKLNHTPDGGSDSGKSDNTWVNGGQAGLASIAGDTAIATNTSSSSTTAAAETTPFKERAKAALVVPEMLADGMAAMPTRAVAVKPQLSSVVHRLPVSNVRLVTALVAHEATTRDRYALT